MAVLMSTISGVLVSTADRRKVKPSVRACESMESGTLMTWTEDSLLGQELLLQSFFLHCTLRYKPLHLSKNRFRTSSHLEIQ
eukprot:66140-Amphidinium_carterae.1